MKRVLFLLVFVTATAVWCPTSFAQRQTVNVDSALDANGVLNGVDIIGNVTLTVGNQNIFTSNALLTSPLLAVSNSVGSQGAIVFNGTSTVFGGVSSAARLLNIFVGGAGAVTFLGPVFTTNTIFTGDGTMTVAPNATFSTPGGLTTLAANTGTLVLQGGSVLDGAVGGANGLKGINVIGGSNPTFAVPGGTGVTGTITGAAQAREFSLGTNTLNIDGALTINTGGVINTTLASTTVFGNIRPVGSTNITGPSILVNVTVPAGAFIPVNTLFPIVQTRTGTPQVGSPVLGFPVNVTVVSPTNPLFTFVADPVNSLNGLVQIRVTGIPLFVPLLDPAIAPAAPIAAAVVPVLLALAPTAADPTIVAADLVLNILAPISALSDPALVVAAIAQLAPSTPALVAPLVTFQGARQLQNLWLARLDDIRCGQISQPDEKRSPCRGNEKERSGFWQKGFGYFGDQGVQGPFPGYDVRIVGTVIAYDLPLSHDLRVGLGLGYARSTIDGKTFRADTESDTYQATSYFGYEPGPWFVYGNASFGWNEYIGTRRISFPGVDRVAQAAYSGQAYTGFLTTGYHFFTRGFTITPFASLQYTRANVDGYTETGAGDVSLKVNSQAYDFLESGLGVTVARPFGFRGGTYVPEVHFKWLRELDNPTLKNTAAFVVPGSPSFTTPGLKTAEDLFNVGGGLTFLSCACNARKWSLEAVYDYEWRTDDYSAHQGMVKFSRRF